MNFFFDARSASWNGICAALLGFRAWRETHAGYCYIRSRGRLRPEIARLCAHLGLSDGYSFADDQIEGDARWVDVTKPWQPPLEA